MSEMVYRVAKAICRAEGGCSARCPCNNADDYGYGPTARAAIRAMRNPTGDMISAAPSSAPGDARAFTKAKWQAMIDEALKSNTQYR